MFGSSSSSSNNNLPLSQQFQWEAWLFDSMVQNVPIEHLLATLKQQGFTQQDIENTIQRLADSPAYVVARQKQHIIQQHHSRLHIEEQHRRHNTNNTTVLTEANLTPEGFEYLYHQNQAAYFPKSLEHWPQIQEWDLDFFETHYGHVEVEAQVGREANPQYQRDFKSICQRMPLSKVIQSIRKNPTSNDIYLAAKNAPFTNEGLQSILQSIPTISGILTETYPPETTALWIGPAGTLTQLHHDWCNALFVQLHGRKEFTLIPANQAPYVYNRFQRFADVNPKHWDQEQFPLFAHATPQTIVLEPGDALFIPVGWWHQVESLDVSISMTFSNFIWNNVYPWAFPKESLSY